MTALRSPLSAPWAFGLAALTGLLYFLAFPGIDLWPLTFVALIPLWFALRGQTPKRAAWLGWTAGMGMTMFGFYWLLEMLQVFSGFSLPLCLVFMTLLCGFQSGRIALLGWLTARGEQRGWGRTAPFVLGFVASELVYPLLFPWTYAATVHQAVWLLQPLDLFGPQGVVLVLVAANLALAELIEGGLGRRAPSWRRVALFSTPLLAALLYAAVRIPQIDAASAAAEKAQLGLVQANMSLTGKRNNKLEGLRRHVDETRKLQAQGPLDLVVWSETSVMSAVPEERMSELTQRFVTRDLGVPALIGSVLFRETNSRRGTVLFNSALLADEKGAVCPACRYDKQFLLAFGEYIPFGETFPVLYDLSPNSGRFRKGESLKPLPFGDRGLATFICYEDLSAGFVRSIVKSGRSDLLVNLTNDAWFGDTIEPWTHFALAKLRAVENRRFFVRSTNSGVSGIIDANGRTLALSETFVKTGLRSEISWLQSWTPFLFWGEAPAWLLALASLYLTFRRRGDGADPQWLAPFRSTPA